MSKGKKTFLIVACIFMIALIGCGVFLMSHQKEEVKESVQDSVVEEIKETEEPVLNVSFPSYSVYTSDDLDFSFIIATLQINENASTYLLSDFVTDEGICLSDVSEYINALEEHSYYLGKKNVWYSLTNNDSFCGNIFIPVKDIGKTSVILNYKEESYTFDLMSHESSMIDLSYQNQNAIVSDTSNDSFSVSDIYEVTGDDMYDGDEVLSLPSSARVFALKLKVESLNEDSIVIQSATFESSSSFEAEGSNIHSMKNENMIGKQLYVNDEGCLFFITLDQEHSISRMSGILKLNIEGQDEPVSVKVSLKGA